MSDHPRPIVVGLAGWPRPPRAATVLAELDRLTDRYGMAAVLDAIDDYLARGEEP